jgi:hypothetical protein
MRIGLLKGKYIVMKDIIALLFLICVAVIVIYLCVKKEIGNVITISLLIFSVVGALAISNHDVIKRFSWGEVEIETYERKIADIKDKAIKEINNEIAKQKESIEKLIVDAENIRDQLYLMEYREMSAYYITGSLPRTVINGIASGPTGAIQGWSSGLMHIQGDKIICKCSPEAMDKAREIIEKMPLYPFSYFLLAICLKEKGDPSWKNIAEKAKSILEKTTMFPKHCSDHDLALQEINKLLEQPEK